MNENFKSPSWYIIQTLPNSEKKVSQRLTEIGFQNYLPTRKQLSIRKDRKKYLERPLFSSYLFIKTDEKNRREVFKVNGIRNFLMDCGKVATVSEDEIERIKKICDFNGDLDIQNNCFKCGDYVMVKDGFFAGVDGYVIQNSHGDKLKIIFKKLGYSAIVEIPKCNLFKV